MFVRLRALLASDFVRSVGETVSTRVVGLVLGLVFSVAVARALGPEGRGLLAVATTLTGLGMQFANMGLHAANTYLVARDRGTLRGLLGNSLVVGLILGLVPVLVIGAVELAAPSAILIRGPLLALALVGIPVGLVVMFLQNLLLGVHEIRTYNAMELVVRLFNLAATGVLLVLGAATPVSFAALGVAGNAGILAWSLRRLTSVAGGGPLVDRTLVRRQLSFGLRAYVAALFSFLVIRADVMMVQYYQGAAATGLYSLAVTMVDLLYLTPVVVGTLLFPRLAALASPAARWAEARRVALGVAGFMAVVGGFAALVARPAVGLLYGVPFEPSVPAFLWLLPGIVVLSVNTIFQNFFAAQGMPWVAVYSPAVATLINFPLNAVLIPRMGIRGAALASTVAYAAMFGMSLLYLVRHPELRRNGSGASAGPGQGPDAPAGDPTPVVHAAAVVREGG